jgi:hypothetical protein
MSPGDMSSLMRCGRAGRPRTFAAVAAASLSLSLLAGPAPPAGAVVRTGAVPPGKLSPADPSTRVAGGAVGYDPDSGRLDTSVRLASPTGLTTTPAIGVIVVAGTWRGGRCTAAPGSPTGAVSGLPDTFGYPPFPSADFFYLTQVKLAALGDDTLDGSIVSVQLSGTSVVMNAQTTLFAGKSWNCAWVEVSDHGTGAADRGFPHLDETSAFPLAVPGAGVALTGRALRVRGGRVALPLRNDAAQARGTVTVRAGRTTVASGRFVLPMLARRDVPVRLTAAGRRLLRARRALAVTVTVAARGARKTTARATLRR